MSEIHSPIENVCTEVGDTTVGDTRVKPRKFLNKAVSPTVAEVGDTRLRWNDVRFRHNGHRISLHGDSVNLKSDLTKAEGPRPVSFRCETHHIFSVVADA